MAKLINQLYPEDKLCDKDIEVTYVPLIDEKTGETIVVLEVCTCEDCGEDWVSQVFTNGDVEVELLAREMGYRSEEDFGEED